MPTDECDVQPCRRSDWPVLLLAGSYDAWLASARRLVPVSAHVAVFGGTATRLYRFSPGKY